MPKEDFKALERHIKELEALTHYPRVEKERASLANEAARLKERVAELEAEISVKNELAAHASKSEAEVKQLASRLDEAQRELSSLKEFKIVLSNGDAASLEELRAEFLAAREEESERRAHERFKELQKDMRSRMPVLVQERLTRVLNSDKWSPEIAKVIDARARQVADGILADRELWPEWFMAHYLTQVEQSVSSKLDSEFESKVRQEVERRLEAIKAREWRHYTKEKAAVLVTSLRSALQELQGTWQFTCDRCGRPIGLEIGPQEVASLLRGERIEMACSTCSDPAGFPLIFSTVPHQVGSLTLERLLYFYMGKAPPDDTAR